MKVTNIVVGLSLALTSVMAFADAGKDKAVKIKLNEVVGLLDQYKNMKNVEENHVSALLRYYDLINDLDGVK